MVNGISLYKSFLDVYEKRVEDQKTVEDKKSSRAEENSEVRNKKDVINLSSEAQALSKIKKMVDTASEVRREKVEEIKNKVQSGEYQMDSKNIATRLIDEVI